MFQSRVTERPAERGFSDASASEFKKTVVYERREVNIKEERPAAGADLCGLWNRCLNYEARNGTAAA